MNNLAYDSLHKFFVSAGAALVIMMILVYLVQASCNTRTLVPQLSGQWFY